MLLSRTTRERGQCTAPIMSHINQTYKQRLFCDVDVVFYESNINMTDMEKHKHVYTTISCHKVILSRLELFEIMLTTPYGNKQISSDGKQIIRFGIDTMTFYTDTFVPEIYLPTFNITEGSCKNIPPYQSKSQNQIYTEKKRELISNILINIIGFLYSEDSSTTYWEKLIVPDVILLAHQIAHQLSYTTLEEALEKYIVDNIVNANNMYFFFYYFINHRLPNFQRGFDKYRESNDEEIPSDIHDVYKRMLLRSIRTNKTISIMFDWLRLNHECTYDSMDYDEFAGISELEQFKHDSIQLMNYVYKLTDSDYKWSYSTTMAAREYINGVDYFTSSPDRSRSNSIEEPIHEHSQTSNIYNTIFNITRNRDVENPDTVFLHSTHPERIDMIIKKVLDFNSTISNSILKIDIPNVAFIEFKIVQEKNIHDSISERIDHRTENVFKLVCSSILYDNSPYHVNLKYRFDMIYSQELTDELKSKMDQLTAQINATNSEDEKQILKQKLATIPKLCLENDMYIQYPFRTNMKHTVALYNGSLPYKENQRGTRIIKDSENNQFNYEYIEDLPSGTISYIKNDKCFMCTLSIEFDFEQNGVNEPVPMYISSVN
jgi:hypothetical protein